MSERQGKVVWAKVVGYPWWPGKVADDSCNHSQDVSCLECQSSSKLVLFFGDRTEHKVNSKSIVPYTNDVREKKKDSGLKQCRNNADKVKFNIAIKEADKLLSEIMRSCDQVNDQTKEVHRKKKLVRRSPRKLQKRDEITDNTSVCDNSLINHISKVRDTVARNKSKSGDTFTDLNDSTACVDAQKQTDDINQSPARRSPLVFTSIKNTSQVNGTPSPAHLMKYPKKLQLTPTHNSKTSIFSSPDQSNQNTPAKSSERKRKVVSDSYDKVAATSNSKKADKTVKSKDKSVNKLDTLSSRSKQNKMSALSTTRSNPKDSTVTSHEPCMPNSGIKSSKLYASKTKYDDCGARRTNQIDGEAPFTSLQDLTLSSPVDLTSRLDWDPEVQSGMEDSMDIGDEPVAQSSQSSVHCANAAANERLQENDTEEPKLSDDEEEMPSLDQIFKRSTSFDPQPDDLVWAKFRRFPFWPAQVIKKKTKDRIYVKFVNSFNKANGVAVSSKNCVDFCGDEHARLKSEASSSKYTPAVTIAIDLALKYLHIKADGESPDANSILYPASSGKTMVDAGDSELSDSDDDDPLTKNNRESSEHIEIKLSDSMESQEETTQTVIEPQPYSEETIRLIKEREDWLKDLIDYIKSPAGKRKLIALLRRKKHPPITKKNLYLGPFAFSQDELNEELLLFVIETHKELTNDVNIPEWCYTHVIPQVVISSIMKVDNCTEIEAKKKFLFTKCTAEEEARYERHIQNMREDNSPSDDSDNDS